MSPPPLGQQPGKWTEGPERITTMGAVFILQEETKLPFFNAARAASPTPWCFLCVPAWTLCGDIYPLSPGDSESQLSASVGRPPTLPSQGLRYRPLPSLGHRAAWPCCPWCSSVAFARHFRALSLPRVPPPLGFTDLGNNFVSRSTQVRYPFPSSHISVAFPNFHLEQQFLIFFSLLVQFPPNGGTMILLTMTPPLPSAQPIRPLAKLSPLGAGSL